jgi:hypothetical protein
LAVPEKRTWPPFLSCVLLEMFVAKRKNISSKVSSHSLVAMADWAGCPSLP